MTKMISASLLLMTVTLFVTLRASATEEIELSHAIDVMQGHEQNVRVLEWKARLFEGSPSDGGRAIVDMEPNERARGFVRFERQTGKYLAEFDSRLRWFQGTSDTISARKAVSFDGSSYRKWDRQRPGKVLPDEDVATFGVISAKENQATISGPFAASWGRSLGLNYLPPYFSPEDWKLETLSDFLRNRQTNDSATKITANSGRWLIETTIAMADHPEIKMPVFIEYDPQKAIVLGCEWGSRDRPWKKLVCVPQEIEANRWMPSEVRVTFLTMSPQKLVVTRYSDIKLNPQLGAGAYSLEFPRGTEVTDYIKEQHFVVGGTPNDEAAAARKFANRQGVAKPTK